MKKYIVGGVLAVAFLAYVLFFTNNNQSPLANAGSPITPSGAASTGNGAAGSGAASAGNAPAGSGNGSSGSSGGAGNTQAAGASNGQYKNGTYTGPASDAFYGTVQVIATVNGGKLTNVKIAQYPHAEGYSIQVASVAMPILTQEAIQAQSANVNAVSGATEDSMAFQQSLAGALSQAQG